MAFLVQVPGSVESFITSSNVTNLVFTTDQYGNQSYTSGGIAQYSVVVLDTSSAAFRDVTLPSGAGIRPLGVALDGPATGPGRSLAVQTSGITKCVASSAISYGDLVYVANSSGQVTTAPAAGATSSPIVGMALTSAAEAGDLISVQLQIGASTTVNA